MVVLVEGIIAFGIQKDRIRGPQPIRLIAVASDGAALTGIPGTPYVIPYPVNPS